jgi:nitrite reductase (cytochrome c-552)
MMNNKALTIILVGAVVVLAALLTGTLIYINNQPAARAFQPLVEVASLEPDSSVWGINFPNQYASLLRTRDNNIRTTFGGSGFSHLEVDPRQVILFTGMAFSKDYNDDRGHEWALIDVNETKRISAATPGTCYSCKSASNPKLWDEMGMEAYDATPFAELGEHVTETIGCANCHEAGTMRLIVTNPALAEAFERQGKDWTTFSRQEMRTVVCANCHVEYYFKGDGKYLTFPWDEGTQAEDMFVYYQGIEFKDWVYPVAETPMLKAQHPEFEMFTANSTHYNAGVSCADCHMPYVRDGAAKYSMHDIHSPLLNPELACGQCHTNVDVVVRRVNTIQSQVYETKLATEDAIIDAIEAIKAAATKGNADATLLNEARQLHREAQFYWDYVSAENSMGFHNPQYALTLLAKSTDLARQAQMKAAQAAGDMSLLTYGVYYTMPVPKPAE